MTPENWKTIKNIVESALELAPNERSAFLDENYSDDAELRRQVESLLAADNTNAQLLDGNFSTAFFGEGGADPRLGTQIGHYTITAEIGTGGMGSVYLAERSDGAFEQKVALKLIKRGMDSDAIQRRFINERQILASLEHPNIAHLIDGGMTQYDLPYFVMEYVEGKSIIDFATSEDLDLRARLELFRKVCSAVSYAHQNLVIHRDLKPSNILVIRDGTPKLLDFGIAKILREETEGDVTATQQHVFTPEYASPEQVRGDNLTTATDVYSLGVILYELLAGSRPYKTESKSINEIVRAICEAEPERPSSAVNRPWASGRNRTAENNSEITKDDRPRINAHSLRGDLDTIILKALRKEPERRYSSVEQLSEDIQRHLDGQPVLAIKDTWSYRASKFVRRNRIVVGAAGLVLLTLLGGLGATLYQRNRAERRFNDVRKLANSFMFEINDQIVASPIKARELLVQRALEYLDNLAAEAGNDAELQSELATAYEKIGDVQAEGFKPNLGKTSEALSSHRKALELRERLFAAEPTIDRGAQVANSHLHLGAVLMMSGQIAESRAATQRSIEILHPLLAADKSNFLVRRRLASAYARHGQSVLRSGSLNESLANYERSLELYQALNAEYPDRADLRGIGIVFSYIGFVRMEKGQAVEAVECYGKWLEIEKERAAITKDDIRTSSDLGTAHTWYGVALNEQDRENEAIEHLAEGVKIQRSVLAMDKDNFAEHTGLADANLELGKIEIKYKHSAEAIKDLETALELYRIVWQNDRDSLFTKHRIASTQRYLADALMQKKDMKKALDNYQESLSTITELTAADPNQTEWQLDLAMCYLRLGEFYLRTKQPESAAINFRYSLPIFEQLAAGSPENMKRARDLEKVRGYLSG